VGAHRQAAERKFDGRLDETRSRRVTLLQERLLVVPEGWRQPVEVPTHLRTVFRAVTRSRVIDLDYAPLKGATGVRRCQPLGLVYASSTWYLLAQKLPGLESRTYRVDRIRAVTTTGERFRRGSDALESLWNTARTERNSGGFQVTVSCHPQVRSHVEYCLSLLSSDTVQCAEGEHGQVLLRARVRSHRAAAGLLSGFGASAEVIEPEQLRADIAALAAENVEMYTEAATLTTMTPQR
jgi:Predicted transcriptional regulator